MSINKQLERLEQCKAKLLEKLEKERAANALAMADVLEQYLIKNPSFAAQIKESAANNNGVNTVKRLERWFNVSGIKKASKIMAEDSAFLKRRAGSAHVKHEQPAPPGVSVNAVR